MLRRREVLALVGSTLASPYLSRKAFAEDAEFTLKYANSWPAANSANLRLGEAATAIKADSKGRLEMQLFPNGQLGADPSLMSQLRSGAIDLMLITYNSIGTIVPAGSLPNVGFAFPDYPAVWRAIDGDLGNFIRSAVDKANIHALGHVFDNGFRQITTRSKPLNGAADLRGLKIRVPPSPLLTSLFEHLGAAPAPLAWPEVYSALQTGVFDAQENALTIVDNGKLAEVQKYCAMTNHSWDGAFTVANPRNWAGLPDDLKAIVERNLKTAADRQRADSQSENAELKVKLEKAGLSFTSPASAPMRETLSKSGFYKFWRDKLGDAPWQILESTAGKLA